MVSHHGTLWIVKSSMIAKHNYENYIGEREVIIKKGEIIEWRYDSANHFRTKDNKWFWVEDIIWKEHCLKIGKIHDVVRSRNKANTQDIWRLELFDWIENGYEIYQNIQKQLEGADEKK